MTSHLFLAVALSHYEGACIDLTMAFQSILITLILLVSYFTIGAGEKDWDLKSFQEVVMSDERVWIVEFYSSMCGSCKEFSVIWEKVLIDIKENAYKLMYIYA